MKRAELIEAARHCAASTNIAHCVECHYFLEPICVGQMLTDLADALEDAPMPEPFRFPEPEAEDAAREMQDLCRIMPYCEECPFDAVCDGVITTNMGEGKFLWRWHKLKDKEGI